MKLIMRDGKLVYAKETRTAPPSVPKKVSKARQTKEPVYAKRSDGWAPSKKKVRSNPSIYNPAPVAPSNDGSARDVKYNVTPGVPVNDRQLKILRRAGFIYDRPPFTLQTAAPGIYRKNRPPAWFFDERGRPTTRDTVAFLNMNGVPVSVVAGRYKGDPTGSPNDPVQYNHAQVVEKVMSSNTAPNLFGGLIWCNWKFPEYIATEALAYLNAGADYAVWNAEGPWRTGPAREKQLAAERAVDVLTNGGRNPERAWRVSVSTHPDALRGVESLARELMRARMRSEKPADCPTIPPIEVQYYLCVAPKHFNTKYEFGRRLGRLGNLIQRHVDKMRADFGEAYTVTTLLGNFGRPANGITWRQAIVDPASRAINSWGKGGALGLWSYGASKKSSKEKVWTSPVPQTGSDEAVGVLFDAVESSYGDDFGGSEKEFTFLIPSYSSGNA